MNRVPRALVSLACALAVVTAPAIPAMAADDASFSITIAPSATQFQAGEKVEVEIGYTCTGANSCVGVTIDVPQPEGQHSPATLNPAINTSPDVATFIIDAGAVQIVMADSIPAGSSGTIGIVYPTYTLSVPNGTSLVIGATVNGDNVPTATASTTVTLTAVPAKVTAQLSAPYPAYMDQDQTHSVSLSTGATDVVGTEGMKTASVELTLPAGAVFVSAGQEPTSVSDDGTTVRWDEFVGVDTFNPLRSRYLSYVVRYPSGVFSAGQTINVKAVVTGTTLSGTPFTEVHPSSVFTLQELVVKFEPHMQFFNSGDRIADGQGFDGIYARGAGSSLEWYLNNYNSTVPVTSWTATIDLPEEFTAIRLNRPRTTAPLVARWRTESGTTGQFSTADYPAVEDLWNPTPAPTFEELGVPVGDRVVHLDIDGPTVAAVGSVSAPGLEGTFDAPDGTSVSISTSVVFHADGFDDVTRQESTRVTVVDPLPTPGIWLSTDSATVARPGDTVTWTATVSNEVTGKKDLRPVLYFLVPKGTRLADTPVTMGTSWSEPPIGFETPTTRVVHNDTLDQDVLVVTWPEAAVLPGGSSFGLMLHTVVTSAPVGDLPASAFLGDLRGPISEYPYMQSWSEPPFASEVVSPWIYKVRDDLDLDGDGTTGGIVGRAVATAKTGSGAGIHSRLEAKGSLDTGFVTAPQTAATESGRPVSYRLPIQNTGNVALSGIVVYDILPHVGDTGVSGQTADLPRGSQFTPRLTSYVDTPAGFTVHYSSSTNPCRPEVYPGQGACDDDWTTTPGDLSQVRALKLVQDEGTTLAGGEELEVLWSLSVTQDVPVGSRAVNSAALAATRDDNGSLLSAESAFVTLEVAQADLGVASTDRTWAAGKPAPLALEISNSGPSSAPAHVEITIPEGLTVSESAAIAQEGDSGTWTCTITGTLVICDTVGLLPVGTARVLPLTVQPDISLAGTTVTVPATVSGRYPDPALANNTVTATFDVLAADPGLDSDPDPAETTVSSTGTTPAQVGTAPSSSGSVSNVLTAGLQQLAQTGASVAGIIVAAAALITVGALIRRRRHAEG